MDPEAKLADLLADRLVSHSLKGFQGGGTTAAPDVRHTCASTRDPNLRKQ